MIDIAISYVKDFKRQKMKDDMLMHNSSEKNPFFLFKLWLKEAEKQEINDPNAMSLATVDSEGMPNVRMVLLKAVDQTGFVFYTNYKSQKGQEILHSRKAALCLHWKTLRRQIRIRGAVETVSDEEANIYFASRPRESRIGAWASKQSHALKNRFALEKAVVKYTVLYGTGNIPRPPFWSGFRICPVCIEFWQNRRFRLHDRIIFFRDSLHAQDWKSERLYP